LGTFSAIDQEAKFIMLDNLGREATLGRRSGGRGAEEDDLIH
jgi:hypothetical protein